jgi:hypothetical protein
MPTKKTATEKPGVSNHDHILRGWKAIAEFLGQPVTVVQRWADEGMPVTHLGRYVEASERGLSEWLGRESGSTEPVHIPTSGKEDLSAYLNKGLAAVRRARRGVA